MMASLVALLLWGPPANAGQRQIAEITATMVEFSPGESAPTPSGNLRITGVAQVLRFEVTDPLAVRIEGQGDSLFAEQHYTIEFLDPKAKK